MWLVLSLLPSTTLSIYGYTIAHLGPPAHIPPTLTHICALSLPQTSTAVAGDLLVFDDLDDLELGEGWSSVAPLSNQNAVFPKGHPISLETAQVQCMNVSIIAPTISM